MATTTINGSFKGSNASLYALKLELSSVANNNANTSNVTASLYMRRVGSTSYPQWSLDNSAKASITINGTGSGESSVTFDTRGTTDWILLKTYTVNNIAHTSDGSKTIAVSATFEPNSTSSLYGGACSGNFTLDKIPRASTPSIGNFNIGSNPTISWTPANSAFIFKLKVVCGSFDSGYTAYIRPSRVTSYSYSSINVPMSAASGIGSTSKSLACTVTLITYDASGNQIGSASATSTATLPNNGNTKPYMDSCILTGINLYGNMYLQGISSVNIKSTVKCRYNATLSKIEIYINDKLTGTSANYTTDVLNQVGVNNIKIVFTDSRGYSDQYTTNVTVTSYSTPYLNDLSSRRWNLTTEDYDDNSNTVLIEYSVAYNPLDGSNNFLVTVDYRIKGNNTWIPGTTSITSSAIVNNLSEDNTYELRIIISDTVGSSNVYFDIVSTSDTLINFAQNGIAFGKASEKENTFECALEADFKNGLSINEKSIVDWVYPVGSIYISVNSVNPSTLFGGTWVAWGTGKVPVGVDASDTDFNTVEKTGGAKTHTHTTGDHKLTASEIPAHRHYIEEANSTSFVVTNARTHTTSGTYMTQLTKTGTYTASGTAAYRLQTDNSGGSGGNHNHGNTGSASELQPYITCYMWKRTA